MDSPAEPPPRPYVMRERARSTAHTRDRILRAVVALFAELPYPQLTLAAVADRAEVSVQTVIRHFGDKEGLIAEAADAASAAVRAQRETAGVGDVRAAVEIIVEHYEQMGGVALRLLAEEGSSPSIARIAEAGRQYHRQWCATVFAPYLDRLPPPDRDRRLAQFVAVCDVYTWTLLRRDAGLSRADVVTAMHEILEPLTRRS